MSRSDTEPEIRMYWTLMRQINLLTPDEMAYGETAQEIADELEVLAEYTDSPRLKRMCLAAAAKLVPASVTADMSISAGLP